MISELYTMIFHFSLFCLRKKTQHTFIVTVNPVSGITMVLLVSAEEIGH